MRDKILFYNIKDLMEMHSFLLWKLVFDGGLKWNDHSTIEYNFWENMKITQDKSVLWFDGWFTEMKNGNSRQYISFSERQFLFRNRLDLDFKEFGYEDI